jgi:signal transduction histidine kinase/CheY-like chemotaxis protein
VHAEASARTGLLTAAQDHFTETMETSGRVLDIRGDRMPDGGLVVTFADVTESVRAAEELLKSNETLEQRVSERTSELSKLALELAKAKAEAEEANLGKTRFIAAASHDILQPLNAARLFTSSLAEKGDTTDSRKLVTHVEASLEAMEEILSTLLDISRLDAGAMKPEVSAFVLSDILGALGREFGPAARDKGLDLAIVPCSLAVRSDRKLLRRILQNLLSNAIKYTPKGRVLMGVRRQGSNLRIEVHDTGIGIASAKQKLIFREFERLDQKKGTEPGLGLGLSIVDRMCKVMRHPLALDSEPGKGSCFMLTVPVSATAALVPEETVVTPAGARIEGLNALVVDNEPAIVEGMTRLLEGWGATVTGVLSAADAIAVGADAARKLDIIFADYHIHREDGIAVVGRLRQMAGRTVPAVLITADRSRAVQDLAGAAGVQYVRKPVKPASLRAALSRALASEQAAE